jgi:hypothetical protein
MGTVTSSPRPDEPRGPAARRPDATDPDLAPVPDLAQTGQYPPYPADAEVAEVAGAGHGAGGLRDGGPDYLDDPDGYYDDDDDPEAVEDGLQGSRERGAEAVAARLGRRPRDMAISVGLLLVVVFSLFGLYRCLGGDDAATVDAGPVYEEARGAGKFPVAEPSGLSSDWHSVSAVYTPQAAGDVLRVGWRSPKDGTLQLIESNLSPDTLVTKELGSDARLTGTTEEINGKQWQVYDARKGERAYVLLEPGRTIIVVGKAGEAELKEFAGSLK